MEAWQRQKLLKQWPQKRERILKIPIPQEAGLAAGTFLSTYPDIDLDVMEEICLDLQRRYAEKYGVYEDELFLYPNGERVFSPERMWRWEEENNREATSVEQWKQKLENVMRMENPQEAAVELIRLRDVEGMPFDVADEAIDDYAEKHGIDLDDMFLYPDGRFVITQELYQKLQGEEK